VSCEHSDTCGPAAAARRKLLLDPWRGERRVALADAHVGAADMLLICTRMERCPPPAAVCSWLAARATALADRGGPAHRVWRQRGAGDDLHGSEVS